MTRYIPTGRARVYRTGQHGFLEMPLEQAQDYVRRNPGTELWGVMKEAEDASV